MARREVGEINAGSMADIAFLLLIFFLVTTTMEVDAGIGRTLPQKLELPPDYIPPEVHDRDVLVIMANSNDQLLVEERPMAIEDLEEMVYDYYTANMDGVDHDVNMPMWNRISRTKIQSEVAGIQALLENTPDDEFLTKEKAKWERKYDVCDVVDGSYMEISKSAIIQLKNQSKTSYGLYIRIQNILKRVVNDLRQKECEKLGWPDYKKLDPDKNTEDIKRIEILRILIPERIIEAKIDK